MTWTTRLWPTGFLYSALALVVTTLSERPGWYVADNRFEQYHSPGRGLASMFAVWDGRRGLGGPREDVWIGTTVPAAMLRSLGLSAVTAERLFHAACLVIAGLGVVALVRFFRPRIGALHLIAGLLVMFGPFSASFLVPSNLYVMFAIGPWLVVIFLRGVVAADRWRSAASFALVVFAVGNADVPGLLYVTLMLAVAACYLVVIERVVRWRDVGAWSVRAGLLALGCSAWALAKTYYAAEPLDARLADTELPSASASASSWSESLRGLGNWLTYFRSEAGLVKPQTAQYLDRPLIVVLTFVPAVVALFVVWKATERIRLLWASMAIVGLFAMVGGFGAPERSPLGNGILWVFEHSAPLTSFRNTYKAAGGLVIGLSILAAAGAVAVVRWARLRNRWWTFATWAVALSIFAGLAAPFVTASLYASDEQMEAVPEHWVEALDYLDQAAAPAMGRTLIVPAISQADYRWGYVGDDIFDALLDRPHAVATGWMQSTRVGHAALEQLTLAAQAPAYRAGVLGPMAARLGITHIVVRNDLDWAGLNIARPAYFDGLRTDPDFALAATFGAPGLGVTSAFDGSPYAADELILPPVEVYRLIGSTAPLEAFEFGRTLIATGDAGAWSSLARAGLLAADTEIVSSSALSDAVLVERLRDGALVVVTDSARRRVRTLLKHEPDLSPTLAEGQQRDRPVRPVYPEVEGSESVAWFRDAALIEGSYVALGGLRNDVRAPLAFDRNPATAWAVPWSGLGAPPSVTVDLRTPQPVDRMTFQSTVTADGLPTVASVVVHFSDESSRLVELNSEGFGELRHGVPATTDVTVALNGLRIPNTEVGLSEVTIDELDLVEYVRSPTELAGRGADVSAALADADVSYVFRRVARPVSSVRSDPALTTYDEEVDVRRVFDVLAPAELSVTGAVRMLGTTSDRVIAQLLDAHVEAIASMPPSRQLEGPAALAIDGDPSTWWDGGAIDGEAMTVRFPVQTVRSVSVEQPADATTARMVDVGVLVDGEVTWTDFGAARCVQEPETACSTTARIRLLSPVEADELTLLVRGIDTDGAFARDRIRISEIQVNSDPRNSLSPDERIGGRCVDLGLEFGPDAAPLDVPVRVDGSLGSFLSGESLAFESCQLVRVEPGLHRLETAPGGMFDEIALTPARPASIGDPRQPVDLFALRRSPDRVVGSFTANGPTTLVLRESSDPQWSLIVDGRRVEAIESDAGNAWRMDTTGFTQFELVYGPSETLTWAMRVSLAAVILSFVLLLRPRRSAVPLWVDASEHELVGEAPSSRRRDAAAIAAATAGGVLLAGWWPLAIGVLTLLAIGRWPAWRDQMGLAPPLLVAGAAVMSALAAPGVEVSFDYASRRAAPSALVAVAVAFLLQSMALSLADARRGAPGRVAAGRPVDGGVRPHHRFDGRSIAALGGIGAACAFAVAIGAGVVPMPAESVASSLRIDGSFGDGMVGDFAAIRPLPAVLAAFAPIPSGLLVGLVSAGFVGLAVALGRILDRSSRSTAAVAGVLGLIVLAVGGWSHAEMMSATLVLSASLLASGREVSVARAVSIGALAALAIMSDPGAVWLLPLVFLLSWRGSTLSMSSAASVGLGLLPLVAFARVIQQRGLWSDVIERAWPLPALTGVLIVVAARVVVHAARIAARRLGSPS